MVKHNKKSEEGGCHLKLRLRVKNEGELTKEELKALDEEMTKLGTSRTGQRTDVTSTKFEHGATLEYVYQEPIMAKSMITAEERMEAFTDFDNPTIFAEGQLVTYKNNG